MTPHRPALAALLCLLAAAAATAQTPNKVPMPVPAQAALRDDVRAACPDVVDALEQELAAAVQMHGHRGTVAVEFGVRDGQVHDVTARGGPGAYRQPIRRALRALPCSVGAGGTRFRLAVRVEPQAQAEAPAPRVARLLAP